MSKVHASSHEYPHVEKNQESSEQNFKGEANNNKQLGSDCGDSQQSNFSS